MTMTARVSRIAFAMTVGAALAWAPIAGAGAGDMPPLGQKKLIYTHGPWGAGLVTTGVVQAMLKRLGYDVELKLVDVGLAYQALGSGKAELFSSAYLPGQQQYLNAQAGKIDILSVSYGPVPGGLMVPAYAPAASIEDLKKPEIQKAFNGKIVGIDAGAGVMVQAKRVIEQYGLNFELMPSSDAAMAASFKAAYDKKEPIIITGYCPHYLCALYDVKFLEDSKGIYPWSQDYHLVRQGFRTDFPRAAAYLARSTLTADSVSKMLKWMETEKIKPEQAAERFVEQNPELVWYWIGDLVEGVPKPPKL
jgi:glycine betaine/proline transport system substrate-binding protein